MVRHWRSSVRRTVESRSCTSGVSINCRRRCCAGTDDANNPFFSPDGKWIAFFAGRKLKKIATTGGPAVTLCDAPAGRGGAWAEDGTIVFLPNNGPGVNLVRVSSAGGTPEPLRHSNPLAEGEVTQRWPQMLPSGRGVLYTASNVASGFANANIVVQPLPSGARKVVLRRGFYGRYLPSGHLVDVQDGTLFAAPFDLDRLETSGPSVPVLEGVASNASGGSAGAAQLSVSSNGTLAYLAGVSISNGFPVSWVDRAAKVSTLRATPAIWTNPAFSPDGRRLALEIMEATSNLWVLRPGARHAGAIDLRCIRQCEARMDARWPANHVRGDTRRQPRVQSFLEAGRRHRRGAASDREQEPAVSGVVASQRPIPGLHGNPAGNVRGSDDPANRRHGMPGKPDDRSWRRGAAELEPTFSPDGQWIAYASTEAGRTGYLCPAVSWPWRQVADLERRWRITDVVAHAARTVLRLA